MDKSLDDIIKQQRSTGRGRGGRGGRGSRGASSGGFGGRRGTFGVHRARAMATFTRGSSRTPQGQWQHDRFNDYESNGGGRITRTTNVGGANSSAKLIINNLDFGVSDNDVKELFAEFGALKRAVVHYDKTGRSLGSAEVIFERRVDAVSAMKQYNNIPLDGREMRIQLVGPNSAASAASSAPVGSRLGTPGQRRGTRVFVRGRGGRGGRGGGAGGRQPKVALTAEQLDADLDAYNNKVDAE